MIDHSGHPPVRFSEAREVFAYYDAALHEVVVSAGLLTMLSQDDVNAVMAHEIGHWKLGHGTKQMWFIALAVPTSLVGTALAHPGMALIGIAAAVVWHLAIEHQADWYAHRLRMDIRAALASLVGAGQYQWHARALLKVRMKLLDWRMQA